MSAYIMVDVTINNPVEYEAYKLLTPASIQAYGGKFIVRGASSETLEGNWQHGRIVILEFPSVERAKEWWNSDEYAVAKAIRQKSATTNMILLEGFS
jgi:uncharacterized protein (DUF1330 family)